MELQGKNRSVWIDPNRDCVVRQFEYVDQDGSIRVTQIDQLVQDSKGHWYSTKWRSGRVLERRVLLPTEVNRDGWWNETESSLAVGCCRFQGHSFSYSER